MSFVDNSNERSYVITYKELIFTFFVFSAILFVLYPKDLLKEQILSEKSNYDLSMLYLKNLLEHSPGDESLMLILAEQSLRSGNKDLSVRLLDLLLGSKDYKIRKEATLLSYELQKMDYFYLQDRAAKAKKMQVLQKLFATIYEQKMYSLDDLEKWYDEAIFVNNLHARHFFLNEKLKKDPYNIVLLKEDYYVETQLKHIDEILDTLAKLEKRDTENKRKWIMAEYYLHLKAKEYRRAEKLLLRFEKSSDFYKEKLAEFYLFRGKYKKSATLYESLFLDTGSYKKKRAYYYKMVEALQSGGELSAAAKKVKQYEDYYIGDIDVRTFMLKVYLATGELHYAAALSKKILKGHYE